MSLVSLQSMSATSSARLLKQQEQSASLSVARLSSGNRIVRAADDVAGLSVATRMLTRETALRSTLMNLAQADSLLQVADGGLQQVEHILQRMNQLSTMASSGSVTKSERGFLDVEFQNLKTEIDRIASKTEFNGVSLLNGAGTASRSSVVDSIDNRIAGTEAADLLEGTAGNDLILGFEDGDAINGREGNDIINAGSGSDNVIGGEGDDTITVQADESANEGTLSVTGGLVMQIDAGTTSNITGHPGAVAAVNDLTTSNNDATADAGAVQSGTGTIGTLNSMTFDGGSFLQVADTASINIAVQDQRSVMLSFETGSDITTRQVLYEQGGNVNGFNIYIDNGRLYVGAWRGNGANYNLHLSTAITADTAYTAGFVFDSSVAGNFRGYLNGSVFATAGVVQNQVSHSGDIGIGGKNNDTRYFDGASGGDGDAFNGEIGEVLNYAAGLSLVDAQSAQNYLINRWSIGQVGASDTVFGGLGDDELIIANGVYATTLDDESSIREIEKITFTGNNENHSITVEDTYYTLGEGLENSTLTVDASGNTEGINVDGSELSAGNLLKVIGGNGADTISGADGEGNVQASYEASSGAVSVDLVTGIVRGNGNDVLNDVTNLIGSANDDTLNGSYGDDTIAGGDGNDIITDIIPDEGEFVSEGLVHHINASDISTITTHPGTVTLVTDQSGAGNSATNAAGNVLSGADTINGNNSLTFDGSSYLDIPNTADINTTGQPQRSIFITFESGNDISRRQVLFEGGGGTNGYNIYIENGRLYVGVWRNGGTTLNLFLSTEIDENTAYAGGFVFDSSGTGTFTGYLNNEQFGQIAAGLPQLPHTGAIGIGGMNNASFFQGSGAVGGNGFEFQGEIGELLIYNNALSSTQVSDLQNFLIFESVNYYGGADVLSGGAGNDTITGGIGDDTIDGGTGYDTAVFTGNYGDYVIKKVDENTYTVSDRRSNRPEGSDSLRNIEQLRFADGTINLKLFDVDQRSLTFQTNQEAQDFFEIILPNVTTENLFINQNVNIATQDAALEAFSEVRGALHVVTAERAHVGSIQSRVGFMSDSNRTALQNEQAARAVLQDTNIVTTSTDYAGQLVRHSSNAAILAQTNSLHQSIMEGIFYPTVGTVAEAAANQA